MIFVTSNIIFLHMLLCYQFSTPRSFPQVSFWIFVNRNFFFRKSAILEVFTDQRISHVHWVFILIYKNNFKQQGLLIEVKIVVETSNEQKQFLHSHCNVYLYVVKVNRLMTLYMFIGYCKTRTLLKIPKSNGSW